jgi:ankyrin repeat protein
MPTLLPEFLRAPPDFRLWRFVDNNNVEKVKKYIANGVDADFYMQPQGITPLINATINGNIDIVRILITPKAEGGGGVDINKGSIYGTLTYGEGGYTALMCACDKGQSEIARLLVEKGADVNATTKDKKDTALIYASFRHNFEIVKLLIENGADINFKRSYDGLSALLASSKSIDIVRYLVENGADVNSTMTTTGNTALMYACEKNIIDVVRFLCKNKADPNIVDLNGKRAIDLTTNSEIKNILMEGCPPMENPWIPSAEVPATSASQGGRRNRSRHRRRGNKRSKRKTRTRR